ncbi:YihY/virulence factor BrkB family protein [Anaerotignum sp. MB30-C6]|uniref:YihY/virulence factor BrkB family protein n=1 Tax=Anaerotignum sp. MB30-C6 TaxID=3070814 RepID=UPI0027DE18B8|nr:YihY/virulence factor BrkB family protein [Anaerotignum sp. MB30-C6]WMI81238.1 YihY/virulence factor BrkB family protein [Anaerotignum sp. MB30-C6]
MLRRRFVAKADRSWKRVIFHTVEGYFDNEISKTAASLTYYLIFAIFPFLIFISSLLGFLHLPMITVEGDTAALLPADVVALINLTIAHMTETSSGAWLTFGLVFTVWFPLRAVKSLVAAINRIYGGKHGERHTLRIIFLTALIIIIVPALLIVLLISQSVLEFINMFIPLAENFIDIWTKIRFLPISLAVLSLICGLYFLSPNVRPPKRYVFPGAIFSMAAWVVFSVGFAYYVDHMGKYSVIYGSIGAIIAFLVWLNASVVAMLMGAVFNHALQNEYDKGI